MECPVVLVVEDEWLVRGMIADHLRAAQCRTFEAHTGEVAVAFLDTREHVDVVFTDIQLGGTLTGWHVGQRFRDAFPRISVIYTSGAIKPDPALAVAQSVFIRKPYALDAILNADVNGRTVNV